MGSVDMARESLYEHFNDVSIATWAKLHDCKRAEWHSKFILGEHLPESEKIPSRYFGYVREKNVQLEVRLERNRWEPKRKELCVNYAEQAKIIFFEAAAIGTSSDCFFDASGREAAYVFVVNYHRWVT